MNELIPYFGMAFLILVFVAAATFLVKRGLWIRKLKHDKTEVRFDSDIQGKPEPQQIKVRTPSIDEIELTSEITRDCEVLGLEANDVRDFILHEAERHPILFLSDFYSLPLVFYQYVLLLSWDCNRVKAERLLNREEAYPINDLWSSCLAAYRKATLLPYRQLGTDRLVMPLESKRSLNTYRRLVTTATTFLDALERQTNNRLSVYGSLPSLLEEVEFAMASDDLGIAVARMEVLLSTVHKLILHHAPQGTGGAVRKEERGVPEFSTSPRSKANILIVDDERMFTEQLAYRLREAGYDVLATVDARTAMRALVDHKFDVVITDMRMSFNQGGFDGREVTLAAKRVNPNTKVIVLTAYFQTTLMADTSCDLVLSKGDSLWEKLPDQIDQIRQQQTVTADAYALEENSAVSLLPRGDTAIITPSSSSVIKILFLAANPQDTQPLRLDAEVRAIDQSLQQAEFRNRFELRQHWAVQVGDIQHHLLRHKPDIVHFSGHGSRASEIILDDISGNSRPVSTRALSKLFSVLKGNIKCVVLNACYSEQQAQAIAQNIDCVIGMSKAIGDEAAIGFAAAFYQALGFGQDVKTAFDLGCVQIDLEGLSEQETPKLLANTVDPRVITFAKNS